MAKNRVAPENKPNKTRGNFFKKPNKNNFRNESNFKIQNKSGKFQRYSKETDNTNNLKPSVSGSDNFFVTPQEKNKQSSQPNSKEIQKPHVSAKDDKQLQDKKPFDKKTWRLHKYSKKYKLQQWEEKRRQSVLRGYYKTVKDDGPKLDVQKIYEEYKDDIDENSSEECESTTLKPTIQSHNSTIAKIDNSNESSKDQDKNETNNSKSRKNKAFKKAHLEFQRIKDEKQKAKEEALKKKVEKEEALKEYKRKKTEKFKKLNKRNKKGQPIMKDRMEMMLESIQKTLESERS